LSPATVRKAAPQSNGQVEPATDPETVAIELVTPEQAQEWLQGNVDNRKLRETRVLGHARTLERGEWDLTGDSLVFDAEGVLINGQHRLTAVVVTQIPARFVILRGVPSRAQEVMDQGLSRNLADQLHRRGVPYTTIVAGSLHWLYRMDYIEKTGGVHYADPSFRPTLRQLLSLFGKNKSLVEEAPSINRLIYYCKVRPGPTLAIRHRLNKIDTSDAEVFFERWTEGTNLAKSDPIFKLREFCINDARLRTTRGRAPDYRYVAYALKAWNYFREDAPMRQLQWKFSTTQKEPWPTPQ
jgi:hypothetical protein